MILRIISGWFRFQPWRRCLQYTLHPYACYLGSMQATSKGETFLSVWIAARADIVRLKAWAAWWVGPVPNQRVGDAPCCWIEFHKLQASGWNRHACSVSISECSKISSSQFYMNMSSDCLNKRSVLGSGHSKWRWKTTGLQEIAVASELTHGVCRVHLAIWSPGSWSTIRTRTSTSKGRAWELWDLPSLPIHPTSFLRLLQLCRTTVQVMTRVYQEVFGWGEVWKIWPKDAQLPWPTQSMHMKTDLARTFRFKFHAAFVLCCQDRKDSFANHCVINAPFLIPSCD